MELVTVNVTRERVTNPYTEDVLSLRDATDAYLATEGADPSKSPAGAWSVPNEDAQATVTKLQKAANAADRTGAIVSVVESGKNTVITMRLKKRIVHARKGGSVDTGADAIEVEEATAE